MSESEGARGGVARRAMSAVTVRGLKSVIVACSAREIMFDILASFVFAVSNKEELLV